MGIKIVGLSVVSFPASKDPSAKKAEIQALYPLESVDSPKFKRVAVGCTTEVSFGKAPLVVNVKYAEKLIESGAFVSDKEYDLKFDFNSDTMDNEIIEFIPVEPSLKDHFKSMGMK